MMMQSILGNSNISNFGYRNETRSLIEQATEEHIGELNLYDDNSNPKFAVPKTKEEQNILEKYFKTLREFENDFSKSIYNAVVNEAVSKLRVHNINWNRKSFNIYFNNYKDKIDATILLPIPRITVFYLEALIETRGLIIRIDEDLVIIQEVSKQLDQANAIPLQFHVILRKPSEVQPGEYVKVAGFPKFYSHKGIKNNLLYIDCIKIEKINEKDADLSCNHSVDTFFTKENLDSLTANTSIELINLLQTHANEEGFKIVQKNSSKDIKCKLLCYMHSRYHKKMELNTDCPFEINIRQIKNESGFGIRWHVTKQVLNHNHPIDPLSFVHKILSRDEKNFKFKYCQNNRRKLPYDIIIIPNIINRKSK